MKKLLIVFLSIALLSCMNKGKTEDPVTQDNVDSLPSADIDPNASTAGSTYSTPIGDGHQTSTGDPVRGQDSTYK